MMIIKIITPKRTVVAEEPILRTKTLPSAEYFAEKAHVPIQV